MSIVLPDASSDKFIKAIEENMFAWIPVFGRLGRTYLNDPPGVRRSLTDVRASVFNSVMDARLEDEQVDGVVQAVLSDARARKVPVLWWISPSTRPVDLGKRLETYGFTHDGTEPGMAVELANLNQSLPAPEGLSIQLVRDDADRRQWSQILAGGFEISESAGPAEDGWYHVLRGADPHSVRVYLGWLDGKPVAISLLLLAEGAAGIYCVATIPEARRKGIGGQMTLQPLLYARSLGYTIGVLEASEMGAPVYRSLGFQEYCPVGAYEWIPE